jgi:hypothetical protein
LDYQHPRTDSFVEWKLFLKAHFRAKTELQAWAKKGTPRGKSLAASARGFARPW